MVMVVVVSNSFCSSNWRSICSGGISATSIYQKMSKYGSKGVCSQDLQTNNIQYEVKLGSQLEESGENVFCVGKTIERTDGSSRNVHPTVGTMIVLMRSDTWKYLRM